jgi:hypothetical protein
MISRGLLAATATAALVFMEMSFCCEIRYGPGPSGPGRGGYPKSTRADLEASARALHFERKSCTIFET